MAAMFFSDQNEIRNFDRGPSKQFGSNWHSNLRREDFFMYIGHSETRMPDAVIFFSQLK